MAHTARSKVLSLLSLVLLVSPLCSIAKETGAQADAKEEKEKARPRDNRTSNVLKNVIAKAATTPGIITLVTGAAFWRMVYKAELEGNTEVVKRDIKWLKDNHKKALSKNYLKRCAMAVVHFVDNVIIGSPGKKRGIKAWGTKLVMDGDPEFNDTEIGPDGEELKFRRYGDKPAYGMMGTAWGVYIYPVISHLKELKNLGEFISWSGKEIGFDEVLN